MKRFIRSEKPQIYRKNYWKMSQNGMNASMDSSNQKESSKYGKNDNSGVTKKDHPMAEPKKVNQSSVKGEIKRSNKESAGTTERGKDSNAAKKKDIEEPTKESNYSIDKENTDSKIIAPESEIICLIDDSDDEAPNDKVELKATDEVKNSSETSRSNQVKNSSEKSPSKGVKNSTETSPLKDGKNSSDTSPSKGVKNSSETSPSKGGKTSSETSNSKVGKNSSETSQSKEKNIEKSLDGKVLNPLRSVQSNTSNKKVLNPAATRIDVASKYSDYLEPNYPVSKIKFYPDFDVTRNKNGMHEPYTKNEKRLIREMMIDGVDVFYAQSIVKSKRSEAEKRKIAEMDVVQRLELEIKEKEANGVVINVPSTGKKEDKFKKNTSDKKVEDCGFSKYQNERNQSQKSNRSCKVGVVHVLHPLKKLNKDIIEKVKNSLLFEIDKVENIHSNLGFLGCDSEDGGLMLTCINEGTKNWLLKVIDTLKPLPGIKLRAVEENAEPRFLCLTYLPKSDVMPFKFLRLRLEKQNDGLSTKDWEVLKTVPMADGGENVLFSVDELSKDKIVEQAGKLFLNFTQISVKIRDQDGKSDIPMPKSNEKQHQHKSSNVEQTREFSQHQSNKISQTKPAGVVQTWFEKNVQAKIPTTVTTSVNIENKRNIPSSIGNQSNLYGNNSQGNKRELINVNTKSMQIPNIMSSNVFPNSNWRVGGNSEYIKNLTRQPNPTNVSARVGNEQSFNNLSRNMQNQIGMRQSWNSNLSSNYPNQFGNMGSWNANFSGYNQNPIGNRQVGPNNTYNLAGPRFNRAQPPINQSNLNFGMNPENPNYKVQNNFLRPSFAPSNRW